MRGRQFRRIREQGLKRGVLIGDDPADGHILEGRLLEPPRAPDPNTTAVEGERP